MGKSEMKCSRCGCKVFHENELDKLECANKTDGPIKDKAKAAFEKLQAENQKLRECVEFYADKARWKENWQFTREQTFKADRQDISMDRFIGGKRARQCLKEIEGE